MKQQERIQLLGEATARLEFWASQFTQKEIAVHLGVSQQMVNVWINKGFALATSKRIMTAREMEVVK